MSGTGTPTIEEIMRSAGVHRNTAYKRLARYKAGLTSREQLLSPIQPAHVRRNPARDDLVDEIMAATGLARETVVDRIRKYRLGVLPKKCLTMSKKELRAFRITAVANDMWANGGTMFPADFGAGLGPRKKPADIPGATAWERKHLGS